MRDEKVVRALHEPYDASLVNEQVTYPRFMASTHVKILEVFPFHEPTKEPPGFGLRQSSGAFRSGLGVQKRQRTAAVQDAIASAHAPPRFMVPMRGQKTVGDAHEPADPLTPSLSPAGGEGVRRPGEGDLHRFMVPMRAKNGVEAVHEPRTGLLCAGGGGEGARWTLVESGIYSNRVTRCYGHHRHPCRSAAACRRQGQSQSLQHRLRKQPEATRG